jgi:methionine synthase I (cobalamin-dependent)
VHRGFVAAGSDLILTNSFGGNRFRLALHGHQDRMTELNRAAARVARRATEAAGRPVLVAGSIGPTGEILAPLGACDPAAAEAAFAAQAAALAEGGCDLLWIETMSAAEEVAAAVRGAAATGLPLVVTMSFDTGGRTMMGLTPADAAALLVAKANCGIPEYRDGQIHYTGTETVMAAYARLARDAGARIVGGCCGTTAAHLAAMRSALDHSEPGPIPDLALIERLLGPLGPQAAGRQLGGRDRRRRSAV